MENIVVQVQTDILSKKMLWQMNFNLHDAYLPKDLTGHTYNAYNVWFSIWDSIKFIAIEWIMNKEKS